MPSLMRERFAEVTTRLLDENDRLAVVTADLTAKLFGTARAAHPHRVINLGIREQLMIGVAGGLALAGMRPIAHSFAPFLIERPFEQIKFSLNHQGIGAVLVSAGGSYDIAGAGRSHQAPGDVALMSTLPDWTIHVPGHPDEAEAHLVGAACGDGLVYVRLSSQTNARPYATGPGFHPLRRGSKATVLVVGPLADQVLAATEGLDVSVLYTSTVRPFDAAALRDSLAGQAAANVVLVEPYLEGTSAPQVAAALRDVPHRLLALGASLQEVRHYGTWQQHNIAHGLDAAGLRRSLAGFLG